MVKLGFVVEDKAFEATIKSSCFNGLLKDNNLELTGVFNAAGRDNLRNNNERIYDYFKG